MSVPYGYQKPLYLTTKRDVFDYTGRIPRRFKAQFQSPRFVKCHPKFQGFSNVQHIADAVMLLSTVQLVYGNLEIEHHK